MSGADDAPDADDDGDDGWVEAFARTKNKHKNKPKPAAAPSKAAPAAKQTSGKAAAAGVAAAASAVAGAAVAKASPAASRGSMQRASLMAAFQALATEFGSRSETSDSALTRFLHVRELLSIVAEYVIAQMIYFIHANENKALYGFALPSVGGGGAGGSSDGVLPRVSPESVVPIDEVIDLDGRNGGRAEQGFYQEELFGGRLVAVPDADSLHFMFGPRDWIRIKPYDGEVQFVNARSDARLRHASDWLHSLTAGYAAETSGGGGKGHTKSRPVLVPCLYQSFGMQAENGESVIKPGSLLTIKISAGGANDREHDAGRVLSIAKGPRLEAMSEYYISNPQHAQHAKLAPVPFRAHTSAYFTTPVPAALCPGYAASDRGYVDRPWLLCGPGHAWEHAGRFMTRVWAFDIVRQRWTPDFAVPCVNKPRHGAAMCVVRVPVVAPPAVKGAAKPDGKSAPAAASSSPPPYRTTIIVSGGRSPMYEYPIIYHHQSVYSGEGEHRNKILKSVESWTVPDEWGAHTIGTEPPDGTDPRDHDEADAYYADDARWKNLPDMKRARAQHSMVVVGGDAPGADQRLIVFGGMLTDGRSDVLQRYPPTVPGGRGRGGGRFGWVQVPVPRGPPLPAEDAAGIIESYDFKTGQWTDICRLSGIRDGWLSAAIL